MTKPELNIGLIGCGRMGKDLFDWLTGFPFAVTWVCHTAERVEQLKKTFVKKQKRALKYNLTNEDDFKFRSEYTLVTSAYEDLAHCDLVIESITEDINLKRELYRALEHILPEKCVLASNTSSIPPDELFKGLSFEKNALGLHFFFPVAVKSFTEINVIGKTDPQTIDRVEEFLKHTGKYSLVLKEDNHFIINRMFLKMQAGCCRLLEHGEMDVAEIDTLIKKYLFPIGVFEFFDYVGNDVMLQSVTNYLAYEKDFDFYLPMKNVLAQKVANGRLGKKTKAGFYDYPLKNSVINKEIAPKREEILHRIIHWYLDGIFDVLNRNICSRKELERIVKEYMMTDKSPFDLAVEVGFE